MTDRSIAEFVESYAAPLSGRVVSVVRYEHPFTQGGLVIVFDDGESDVLGLIGEVYRHGPPPGLSLHCLRREELFQLSTPGIFTLPLEVNEHPHLPFYVRHKGVVLFGHDIRGEVEPHADARVLLDNHIEGCMTNFRTLGIMSWLHRRQYLRLVGELDKQLRYLMATALLVRGEWEVEFDSLPQRFDARFADARLKATWQDYADLRARAEGAGESDEAAQRASAFEAVWLFESFMRRLKEVAS